MEDKLYMNTREWTDSIINKLDKKMSVVAPRLRGKMPFISVDGKYDDRSGDIGAWTNGFFGGMMWMMYILTKKDIYKAIAIESENQLDGAFRKFERLCHDVGFMWIPTSGINYKLFGSRDSELRMLYAACTLFSRFHIKGGFIKAWNECYGFKPEGDYTIIDCMMNIPLLYWASDLMGDDRFRDIAKTHADKTIQEHIRDDGSVIHIAVHDQKTGDLIATSAGQGYDEDSAWSRGQAWAIYGFIISYIHTGDKRYLDVAERTANYFIASVCDDYLPRCDFRSPKEPVIYDSSAGAIAVCGLLEIAKYCGKHEADRYKNHAVKLLMTLEEKCCDWSTDEDGILGLASRKYHIKGDPKTGHNIPIIFGDYFFLEAVAKLADEDFMIW